MDENGMYRGKLIVDLGKKKEARAARIKAKKEAINK
jgi:hypothetical protein